MRSHNEFADGFVHPPTPHDWLKRNDRERETITGRKRSHETVQGSIFRRHRGAGALLSGSVVSSEIIAYEDLGPEAVVRLQVRAMPLFVINDIYGNDLYETGMERYQK